MSAFDFMEINSTVQKTRDKTLFFVGGAVKSGTTWLQLLLDKHPNISCRGEGHLFDRLATEIGKACDSYNVYIDDLNKRVFSEMEGYPLLSESDLLHLVATAASLLLGTQGKGNPQITAVGEKTPLTLQYLPLADALFPSCKIIFMVRDGRDCAVSGWYHNQRINSDWAEKPPISFTDYVGKFARGWAGDMENAHAFIEKYPDRSLVVHYERLLADPQSTMAGMCRFLGVDDSPHITASCCDQASFRQLTGGRAAGEESQRSFFRKGIAGDWRNHFDQTALDSFQREAGTWMSRLGYGTGSSPASAQPSCRESASSDA